MDDDQRAKPQEEQARDSLLLKLLKSPPEPRPKRQRQKRKNTKKQSGR